MRSSLRSFNCVHAIPAQNVTVCQGNVSLQRQCLRAFDAKRKEGKTERPKGFSMIPVFSTIVKRCVPVAVKRSHQRPLPNEWETVDPRNPKNKIVTLENGEKRISKNGKLLPLYRDWEKEFGKPTGDHRPYYRKYMGPLLMPHQKNPSLQQLSSLIVVEGLNDWKAVKAAVDAQVFVCDGASILDHVHHKYVKKTVSSFDGDVIVLMDPDTAGRRMRTAVNQLMKPCKHAFVSEYDAVVGMGRTYESIGIENATPESIQKALKCTKTFTAGAEQEIKFDTLYEMGLVQTPAEQIEGVRLRRRFTCGFLGIGFSDGRQLLKQLNGYQFSLEEIQSAVAKANVLLEEWKKNPWKLQKDYGRLRSPPEGRNTFVITRDFMTAF